MKQAVTGCAKILKREFPESQHALFLCGKGNNGNDGLWLASLMQDQGWNVSVILSHEDPSRKEVKVKAIQTLLPHASLWPKQPRDIFIPEHPLIIIDALLGIGVKGAPRSPVSDILNWVEQHSRPFDRMVALDFPTGIDVDSGEATDTHFHAHLTLSIGSIKKGALFRQGRDAVGKISPVSISLDRNLLPLEQIEGNWFDEIQACQLARPLPASTYKHRQGDVVIWAGSPSMLGAARLASEATLRSGAGLVRISTDEATANLLRATTKEIMILNQDKLEDKGVFENADAVLIGPGLEIRCSIH